MGYSRDEISLLRSKVASFYPGKGWKEKVAKMPPNQLFAIERSMDERNRKKKERAKKEKELGLTPSENMVQMNLFDWMKQNKKE